MYFGYGGPSTNEGQNSKEWVFSDRCCRNLGPSSLPPSTVPTHHAHTVQEICASRERQVHRGHTQGQNGTYTVIRHIQERVTLTAHVRLGEPWVNRGCRQSGPGMVGGIGFAQGVLSPVTWHLYHGLWPSPILKRDDAVYQTLPEYAQTLAPLLS